jgi:acetolactate synthase regulatory subunit
MARPGTAEPHTETAMPTLTQRLDVATTGQPDTLPRVLIWLRRRGCTLTRVDYAVQDRHGPGRFVLSVDAPPRHQDRLICGLESLVGVTKVHRG